MIKLVRFDLCNPAEWAQFYRLFSAYLAEVCDGEEYRENMEAVQESSAIPFMKKNNMDL